jgi:hypothetical protein
MADKLEKGWEICSPSCPAPRTGNGKVWCPQPDPNNCENAGCRCRLFSRRAGSGDDVEWNHEKESDYGKAIPEDPHKEYKCFCTKHTVKRIFPVWAIALLVAGAVAVVFYWAKEELESEEGAEE